MIRSSRARSAALFLWDADEIVGLQSDARKTRLAWQVTSCPHQSRASHHHSASGARSHGSFAKIVVSVKGARRTD
jgi:hypothetical protein